MNYSGSENLSLLWLRAAAYGLGAAILAGVNFLSRVAILYIAYRLLWGPPLRVIFS